jgi:hypothetical protein
MDIVQPVNTQVFVARNPNDLNCIQNGIGKVYAWINRPGTCCGSFAKYSVYFLGFVAQGLLCLVPVVGFVIVALFQREWANQARDIAITKAFNDRLLEGGNHTEADYQKLEETIRTNENNYNQMKSQLQLAQQQLQNGNKDPVVPKTKYDDLVELAEEYSQAGKELEKTIEEQKSVIEQLQAQVIALTKTTV